MSDDVVRQTRKRVASQTKLSDERDKERFVRQSSQTNEEKSGLSDKVVRQTMKRAVCQTK
ncbi:hypothetical protein [Bacillus sp. SJS]|uniref:hypothetical protein n=1 Tax=Bacillus sp. SJS TaxID=1423321 RepID=UPI0018D49C10|nr:hypothetical protein [Bacillus sp. SJS]